ncbi:tyrosine-type recombinase/integrase [Dyella sedimenti]|uniref:tyrosine-type recombinase/integrase n=1 Tax=Dyella sedimenti TaxID=2919947 RepID=UPI001FA9FD2A|nr:site-specific integrase [Dyella sedimenti]
MAKGGFTDVLLKSLTPRATRYTVYEKGGIEGFAVDVMPSGKLSFRYRYRFNGKRQKVTVGSYPKMRLAVAHDLCREMERMVQRGISPAAEKKRRRAEEGKAATFGALAADWVANVLRKTNKNPSQDEGFLRKYILPSLQDKKIVDIDRAAVWMCIDLAKKKNRDQAARRVHSVLKRVFDYAIRKGDLPVSPVAGIDPKHIAPARARDRVLSPEEIPVWLHTIETSSIPRSMKLALRLLLLIPARKGELLAARWVHVDLNGRTWDVPKENSKNGTPLRHRLSDQATAIFEELQVLAAGSDWVLPSSKGGGSKPLTKSGINTAIRGLIGLPKNVVIHDLRRTVRTYLTELGIPQNVAELCLNHRPTGIKRVYDRSELLDQRYQALQQWERYLQKLLAPELMDAPDKAASEIDVLLEKMKGDEALKRHVLKALLTA